MSTRQATADELEALGWLADGLQWRSPVSGAAYSADELLVSEYATTIDGERQRGPWLFVSSDSPLSERYCERLTGEHGV